MPATFALPSPLLLFRQVCLLAAVAGILTWREPAQGALCLFLLWIGDLPRSRMLRTASFMAVAFVCGLFYAQFREIPTPAMPPWLDAAVNLVQDPEQGEKRPPAVRIQATVDEAVPQGDDRLRIILTDIRLAPAQLGTSAAASQNSPDQSLSKENIAPSETYGGDLVWTWKGPLFAPLPGTRIEVTLRPSLVRDMKNPGTWSTEQYWQDRNVFLRAWSSGKEPAVHVLPGSEVPWLTRLRAELRRDFLSALFGGDAGTTLADNSDEGRAEEYLDRSGQLSPGASMLPALIFGDRSFLSPENTDRFARATLAHSLALSGLHLGYAVAAGFAFAWALGRLFPLLLLRIPRPRLAVLIALPLAGGYLWLGQAPVSLARAALMLVFWTLLLFLHRPKVLLDGLLAAVGVLLLFDPAALFDLSLQLSALSVAVIALSLPMIQGALRLRIPGHGRVAAFARGTLTILCISFAIQVVLAPLTIRTFGVAGIWFPLNVLWLPILGAWTMPLAFVGLLLAALGLPAAAAPVLYLASLPGEWLFSLLAALDTHGLLVAPVVLRPHWLGMAGFWLLCLGLPQAIGRITRFAHAKKERGTAQGGKARSFFPLPRTIPFLRAASLLGLGLMFMGASLFWSWQESTRPGVRLRLLDVGQGQAVLVEWGSLPPSPGALPYASGNAPGDTLGDAPSASGRILIDGGGFSSSSFDVGKAIVAPILTDNRLPSLDAVISSHPDTDHLAGLLYILRTFRVSRFMENGDSPPPSLDAPLREILAKQDIPVAMPVAGDSFLLAPGLTLEVLWPPREPSPPDADEKDRNSDSLILRLVWEGVPLALICGDAEASALRTLLEGNVDLTSSVLILPHHGSGKSAVPGFYAAVHPKLALASCGYGNQWGFPSLPVRRGLEQLGVPLHTTAESGQIRLEWQRPNGSPTVEFARPSGTESK